MTCAFQLQVYLCVSATGTCAFQLHPVPVFSCLSYLPYLSPHQYRGVAYPGVEVEMIPAPSKDNEDDDEAFLRSLVLPEEERYRFTATVWCGGFRWFRATNVVCLEKFRRLKARASDARSGAK